MLKSQPSAHEIPNQQLQQSTVTDNTVNPSISQASSTNTTSSSPSSSSLTANATSSTSTISNEEWLSDEQAAFESALRTVPKDAEDRWEQIAKQIGTKSKKQCIARFKQIREMVLKNKK